MKTLKLGFAVLGTLVSLFPSSLVVAILSYHQSFTAPSPRLVFTFLAIVGFSAGLVFGGLIEEIIEHIGTVLKHKD